MQRSEGFASPETLQQSSSHCHSSFWLGVVFHLFLLHAFFVSIHAIHEKISCLCREFDWTPVIVLGLNLRKVKEKAQHVHWSTVRALPFVFQPSPQPSRDGITDDVADSWGSIPQFWITRCSCMDATFFCVLAVKFHHTLFSSTQKSERPYFCRKLYLLICFISFLYCFSYIDLGGNSSYCQKSILELTDCSS